MKERERDDSVGSTRRDVAPPHFAICGTLLLRLCGHGQQAVASTLHAALSTMRNEWHSPSMAIWASENGLCNSTICKAAAKRGNIAVLDVLRNHWRNSTSQHAAGNGHFVTLQWLRRNECNLDASKCCADAARGGHLNVLKWAKEDGFLLYYDVVNIAASKGHLDTVKWAIRNGNKMDFSTCQCAALGGHVELVRWFFEHGVGWCSSTFNAAASAGHKPTLECCLAYGCPWSKATCRTAAYYGQLETLQWLRGHGCPWDRQTVDAARAYGFSRDCRLGNSEWLSHH